VSSTHTYGEQPDRHSLLPGATPAAIHAALLPADQANFDAAYGEALATARQDLDLTELFTTLEQWRKLAALQSDPDGYRRMVHQVVETVAGPVPPNEPLEVTRRRVGL
jgi:hypothetical protein